MDFRAVGMGMYCGFVFFLFPFSQKNFMAVIIVLLDKSKLSKVESAPRDDLSEIQKGCPPRRLGTAVQVLMRVSSSHTFQRPAPSFLGHVFLNVFSFFLDS